MGLLDNDPDMWAVEARFKGGKKMEAEYDPVRSDKYGNDLAKIAAAIVPENRQVAGDHYAKMKIQPALFSRANDYDSDAFSILKYLARHKSKKGREDVEKALSFVYIRDDNKDFYLPPRWRGIIRCDQYIEVNGIDADTAAALRWLDAWILHHPRAQMYNTCKHELLRAIQKILDEQYPLI